MDPGRSTILMVFANVIPLMLIIGGIFFAAWKIWRGGSTGKKLSADETRLIQEIHNGLMRMEERIEALETLLLDRAQKEKAGHKTE